MGDVETLFCERTRRAVIRAVMQRLSSLHAIYRQAYQAKTGTDAFERGVGRACGILGARADIAVMLEGPFRDPERLPSEHVRAALLHFFTPAEAFEWLFTPNSHLGGEIPWNVLDREGATRVLAAIDRLATSATL